RARGPARHSLPRCQGLLHQRPAGARGMERRAADQPDGVRPVLPLDALSILARRAHATRPIAATRMTPTMPNLVLTWTGLSKHFQQGDTRVDVLRGVELQIAAGERIA